MKDEEKNNRCRSHVENDVEIGTSPIGHHALAKLITDRNAEREGDGIENDVALVGNLSP